MSLSKPRRFLLLNKVIRQRVFHHLNFLLYRLPHRRPTILVHIRRTPPPHKLLRDRPQPPEDVREPELQHGVALRLLLPKVEPALRAAVLVPRRAARGGMLERQRRRAEALPHQREAVIPHEQPHLLLGRDDQSALGVEDTLRRVVVFGRRLQGAYDDDVGLLHDLEIGDAAQGTQVEFVRQRHREMCVLDRVAHELLHHADHRVHELLVRTELRKPHEA